MGSSRTNFHSFVRLRTAPPTTEVIFQTRGATRSHEREGSVQAYERGGIDEPTVDCYARHTMFLARNNEDGKKG